MISTSRLERVLPGGTGVQERQGRAPPLVQPVDDLPEGPAQLQRARHLPLLLQPDTVHAPGQ